MSKPTAKLEVMFEAAVALETAAQRAEYLNRACPEPELRREVESLLAAHEKPDSVFADETVPGPSTLSENPGTVIGRYKLLEKLGEGGFGSVWLAEQREPVRRKVALKVIKLGMDTRQVIARFEAERQALAMMDHPNIAKVLDGGATEAGRPYFVMELVRGIPLTRFCDENRLTPRKRLELMVKVCQAVQHAHQKGIIHRDLKPSNVLVSLHDGVPVPKVIDFGIAKATQQELTDKTLHTLFQQFIGTPAYVSPEQAEMSGLDIDTRSDIYSLGVLLYELLTGTTPFDAQELLKAGFDEMRRIIRETEPDRPSARLTQLRSRAADLHPPPSAFRFPPSTLRFPLSPFHPPLSAIDQDLDWIVMKCLEKDRARRYETANGLAADLQRHLGNEPVTARPPSAAYRFQKTVRRNKPVFAAAAVVLVVLLGGIVASTWQAVRATRAEREQSRLRQQAQAEALTSEQVTAFLQEMLRGARGTNVQGRDTTLIREILDRTAGRVADEFKSQPAVEAKLRTTLGNAYEDLGEYTVAEAMHRQALAIHRRLHGDSSTNSAENLVGLGLGQIHRKNFDQAKALLLEALAMQERLLGPDHIDLTSTLMNLAYVAANRGDEVLVEALNQRALAIVRKAHGPGTAEAAPYLYNLSGVAHRRGDYPEAERLAGESLTLSRSAHGNAYPGDAATLELLAELMEKRGEHAGGAAARQEALGILRKAYPGGHPDMLPMLQNQFASRKRDPATAEAAAREALEIVRKFHGEEHEKAGRWRAKLKDVLQQTGKLEEIEKLERKRLADMLDFHTNAVSQIESHAADLASTLTQGGKYAEAVGLYRVAVASRSQRRPVDDDRLQQYQASLGRTLTDWAWTERFAAETSSDSWSQAARHAREAERLLQAVSVSRASKARSNDWRLIELTNRFGLATAAVAMTDPSSMDPTLSPAWTNAEGLLSASLDGLRQVKPGSRHLREAIERLVRFHDGWVRLAPETAPAGKLTVAREQLAEFDRTKAWEPDPGDEAEP